MPERVQVVVVGAGPSGLLLARLLQQAGIDVLVLERQSRAYVESRIRAGVLEAGSVALLERAGAAGRLHRECLVHEGVEIASETQRLRLDFRALADAAVTVYGQTEVTRDLGELLASGPQPVRYEAEDVALHDLATAMPRVTWRTGGQLFEVACDFVAGCDGFHGISRRHLPEAVRREFIREYPSAWLGLLADVPPVASELIYARHADGFALCSMRSNTRSRYYVQVDATARLEDWPDDRFWTELRHRLPKEIAAAVITGPAVEKSIAPLRSFVCEPLRHGALFLAGDAAHIVPPTGAKGLNLAFADVGVLADALLRWYGERDAGGLDTYSEQCLARVWKAERFSWWFTALTHRFDADPFTARLQEAEFALLAQSRAAQELLARQYVGRF